MDEKRLAGILEQHALWIASDRKEGNGANLSEAYLPKANLQGAILTGACLKLADLSDANLAGADLREANLFNADLSNANLAGADLSKANLGLAGLMGTNLLKAKLDGTWLRGARLPLFYWIAAKMKGAILRLPEPQGLWERFPHRAVREMWKGKERTKQ